MSYGRDRDAATRGIGAIASRDMQHPRAVRRRQIAKARRLARADRALSGLTYGPVGGLSGGLGAINAATNTPTGMTGGIRRPTLVKGGPIEGGGQTPIQIAVNNLTALPPRTFISPPKPPPPVYTGNVVGALTAIPGIKVISPAKPKKPLPGKRPPPTPTAPPLPEPSGSTTPTGGGKSSGGSSSGGGGGGGSSGGGGGGATLPDYTPDDLPDPEDVPEVAAPTAGSGMSTGKMIAIGGGIAAVLYLLLQGDD